MAIKCVLIGRALAATLAMAHLASAADHGPVFGLATPTNPKGGWSFDLGSEQPRRRWGSTSTRSGLSRLTGKAGVSGSVVFQPDASHAPRSNNAPIVAVS